ncbi:MAG TPA: TIGR03790 family protein [Opitutaceae bacterium]
MRSSKQHAGRTMRMIRFLFVLGLLVPFGAARAATDDLAARVIILANSDEPESVRLARAYARRRSIPEANIIALRMPSSETISWTEFVSTIYEPLQDELLRRRWLDGTTMDLRDNVGRRKVAMAGHRISYLVVCRGVPLRIAHASSLYTPVPRLTDRVEFRTNSGAVDSELSLLAQSGFPINAFVPNPLFRNDQPRSLETSLIVKVSRLDGPTYDASLAMVEGALEAERNGLIGRAYVDIGGVHPDGDQWLESAAQQLAEAGYDLEVERGGATLPSTARADAAAFYFGWYAPQINGPFALPGYRFAPGAVALHIHSFSAQSLRSENGGGWTGPLVARGVAATFGNVGEPYLQLTHQPQLVLRALLRGWTLGDAAYYAMPAISWQGIVLGDPLYRPGLVSFAQQWANRRQLEPAQVPYVVLREVNRLRAEGRREAAMELLMASEAESSGLALVLERATWLHSQGQGAVAIEMLEQAAAKGPEAPAMWGLRAEAARRLNSFGATRAAVAAWKDFLTLDSMPPAPRLAWLREAWSTATEADDLEQATRWEREITSLGGSVSLP